MVDENNDCLCDAQTFRDTQSAWFHFSLLQGRLNATWPLYRHMLNFSDLYNSNGAGRLSLDDLQNQTAQINASLRILKMEMKAVAEEHNNDTLAARHQIGQLQSLASNASWQEMQARQIAGCVRSKEASVQQLRGQLFEIEAAARVSAQTLDEVMRRLRSMGQAFEHKLQHVDHVELFQSAYYNSSRSNLVRIEQAVRQSHLLSRETKHLQYLSLLAYEEMQVSERAVDHLIRTAHYTLTVQQQSAHKINSGLDALLRRVTSVAFSVLNTRFKSYAELVNYTEIIQAITISEQQIHTIYRLTAQGVVNAQETRNSSIKSK